MSPLWSAPPHLPTSGIKKLLVANRGEIAIRILHAARELGLQTITLHTSTDTSHTHHAHASLALPSASSFLDGELIIALAKREGIDAIHPGYGFLSESAEFARMCATAGIRFVGPEPRVLGLTGSKTLARGMAMECGVPVLRGLESATDDIAVALGFVEESKLQWPVVIKAVDGGGGRGIRFVHAREDFEDAFRRACGESSSGKVFVEAAAGERARHVEVQVAGDSHGNVVAVGTRECSIQRRFQKVVEFGPSALPAVVLFDITKDSVRMAQSLSYTSLATFEWLVDPTTEPPAAYFLEINPRLQVEHTVTEALHSVDLVKWQLLIAQGHTISDCVLTEPRGHAIQLRVTAEDPGQNFSLSLGRVRRFVPPTGNGVRVDTHLRPGEPTVVGPDFDSLLCKIIVHGETWEAAVRKAQRALDDTVIEGVKTNIPLLRGIVTSPDFLARDVGTRWLEENLPWLIAGEPAPLFQPPQEAESAVTAASIGPPLLRKGNAWIVQLSPSSSKEVEKHHFAISRLLQNDFPNSLAAEITHQSVSSSGSYKMIMAKTTLGASVANHRKGDPGRPDHVVVPFMGEVIEVGVRMGDILKANDVICVVKQMKTELEVRASRPGVVRWVWEVGVGDIVEGGELVCELSLGEAEPKL